MKKRDQARFEQELLQALRSELDGPPRAAARVHVSKQLQATFAGLDLGIEKLASLPHSAAPLKASASKAGSAATSSKASTAGAAKASASVGAAAKTTFASFLPALTATAHPVATVLATFAFGAAAGTGIMVASGAAHAPHKASPTLSQPARVNPAPSAQVVGAASPRAPHSSEESRVPPVIPPARSATIEPRRHIVTAPPAPAPAASQTAPADPLAAQQALLDQARTALSHGDAERALSALAEHERAFNSTLFEEERLSLKIKSLAASGHHDDARAMAQDFGARFPRSILLPSVQAAASREKP